MRHINDTYACMDACSEHCIYVHTYIYVLARRLNEELQAKTASLLKEADSFIMVSFGKCRVRQLRTSHRITPHFNRTGRVGGGTQSSCQQQTHTGGQSIVWDKAF